MSVVLEGILQKDLKYWVALSTNLNIGAKTFKKLENAFCGMDRVWKASDKEFQDKGINPKIVEMVKDVRKNKNPDEELEKLAKYKIGVLTSKDQDYPELLKEVPDAPALLYFKGNLASISRAAVAVVGSRKFSYYGQKVTEFIVGPLAQAGIVIVSGLALGIDSIAHKNTIENNGITIAVLGNGLDAIYPSNNRYLADKIVQSGGVLFSEFPLGTPSFKYNFPFRNRIIAGLSLGTLVVEAGTISGSLITARCALDYNREVFAVPGDIFRESSQGPNGLIKMGAKLVMTAEDILSELNIKVKIEQHEIKNMVADTKDEALVLKYLSDEPAHIDKIVTATKLDIITINQTLVMMEMKGKIRNLGGNQYVINH